MNRHLFTAPVVAVFFTFLSVSTCSSQEVFFGKAGTVEIAGSVSFSSITPVTHGRTGEATTLLSLGPEIGYFVADGFEIGFNPGVSLIPGVSVITPSEGEGLTIMQLFAYPAYVVHTEGSPVAPFLQVPIGYTAMTSNDVTQSGFSWGVKGGLKVTVASHVLITIYGQYLAMTFNPEGTTERYGFNFLSFGVGVGGFL
ncbi:MAG: hypothetical protein IT282_16015 [Bacteroidetes bacterium]|nr:hypothetical protein [Bacteroidota bacterium]